MSVGPERKPLLRFAEIKTPPFTSECRQEAGELLGMVQEGQAIGMPRSRPMPSTGRGVHELRIRDTGHNWRIVHVVRRNAIVLLLVFARTTRRTPKDVIELCRQRMIGLPE